MSGDMRSITQLTHERDECMETIGELKNEIRQLNTKVEYYYDIIIKVGKLYGIEEVMMQKIPDLVNKTIYELNKLKKDYIPNDYQPPSNNIDQYKDDDLK